MARRNPLPVDDTCPLSELDTGDRGRVITAEVPLADREVLRAHGLDEGSFFQIKKAGEPWILEIRSTRIALSDFLARRVLVSTGSAT